MREQRADHTVRHLELRLGIPNEGGSPTVFPVVQIMIDGDEKLAAVEIPGYGSGFVGSPPAAILGKDTPLLPAEPPRRVVLYLRTAGDPGDGCIAPRICKSGNYVIWHDFSVLVGLIDDAPLVKDDPTVIGEPIDLPDVWFDATQYIAEVRRVTAEREWESGPWRTALLLDQALSADPWALGAEWHLGWVEPQGANALNLTCWDVNIDHGIVVTLVPGPGTPEERARIMAEYRISHPSDQWPVTRHVRAPSSWRNAAP
jgi:hypothetical protein